MNYCNKFRTQPDKTIHKKDSTKNDASYAAIPMPDIIKVALKKWKSQQTQYQLMQPNDYIDEGYVCTQPDGSFIKPDYVSHHFRLLLKKNSLPVVRFHDLRHSAGSYLKYLGFDIIEIQEWLRHADIKSTRLYTHLDMAAKTEMANSLNKKFTDFGFHQNRGQNRGH